jgi:hypothetical protein
MTNLKFKTLAMTSGVASLMAFSSLSVLAEGPINYPVDKPFQSTLTRDEVRAEAVKAVVAGIRAIDAGSIAFRLVASGTTRDKVLAEYFQAAKEGTLQVGEIYAPVTATASSSSISREAVLAETTEWLRVQRGDTMMGGR